MSRAVDLVVFEFVCKGVLPALLAKRKNIILF